jgi:hypothetical protein
MVHMSPFPLRAIALCGILTFAVLSSDASAQLYPFSSNCVCQPPQMIPVTSYRNVPVTEYHQVKQTVRRPVYETKWEDREVTAYRPVTETKTVEVPTTTYDTVTEYQTVHRNQGYWTTQVSHRYKPTPCQYDPRPNVIGWLNRTAYSLRAPFIPVAIPRRQYVSNVVAQVVPVVRRVPRTEMRKVTYNETKMVAYTTTKKVAVSTVSYIDQERVTSQPVTVMRTVPVGTRLAYAYPSSYGIIPTQTALAPVAAPVRAQRNSSSRTADSKQNKFDNDRSNDGTRRLDQDQGAYVPQRNHQRNFAPAKSSPEKPTSISMAQTNSSRTPTIGRLGGWVVRKRKNSNPTVKVPGASVANNKLGGWVVRKRRASNPAVTTPGISVANK